MFDPTRPIRNRGVGILLHNIPSSEKLFLQHFHWLLILCQAYRVPCNLEIRENRELYGKSFIRENYRPYNDISNLVIELVICLQKPTKLFEWFESYEYCLLVVMDQLLKWTGMSLKWKIIIKIMLIGSAAAPARASFAVYHWSQSI